MKKKKKVLSLENMDEEGLKTVLLFDLPENPTLPLLKEAREQVIDFLDFNTGHWPTNPDELEICKQAIKEACEKLVEIMTAISKIFEDKEPWEDRPKHLN
ncbi:MAG: hypothetical protein ABSH41_00425 [Syntrophobacteraceae bacterium]